MKTCLDANLVRKEIIQKYFSRQDGTTLEDNIDLCVLTTLQSTLDPSVECDAHILSKKDPDFVQLRLLFGWLSP
jgi:hypothetical protein